MHSIATIREIDRLLHEGKLSQRQIALHLHVSRGTVNAIATGRRGLYGNDGDDRPAHRLPPARCGGCGYRVYLPCRICEIRKVKYNHDD